MKRIKKRLLKWILGDVVTLAILPSFTMGATYTVGIIGSNTDKVLGFNFEGNDLFHWRLNEIMKEANLANSDNLTFTRANVSHIYLQPYSTELSELGYIRVNVDVDLLG